MTLYQGSAPMNKMATRAKNRKTLKWYILLDQWTIFKIIAQKCFLSEPLPKLLKGIASLNKIATRAKKKKNPLNDISS